ncbi:MAG: AMP-binding protein [Rhodospirillales bacterium]|nr:AMP-binding protein [Rhodospirillales bacterium]
MHPTIHATFAEAARAWPDHACMAVLEETAELYGISAGEITYAAAAMAIGRLTDAYRAAGYGIGHRVGLLLENRPDFILHWFALNGLGAAVVPINPDLRAAELEYLVTHSEIVLAVAIPARQASLRDAAAARGADLAVIGPDAPPPPAARPATVQAGEMGSEAALLYTSGTTGLPKGCIVSNFWFLRCGQWYLEMGGLCALRPGAERMLTPLPLFHMNAMACSVLAMVMSGGCLIVLDRFHPRSWWHSVIAARATIIHYLGVMPAILMAAPPAPEERAHAVRFGFGAGIDRRLHAPAEARFGFPLIEGWAMTETGAAATIQDNIEPRRIGESCIGTPRDYVQVRIEAEGGREAETDEPGELLVRASGPDPRAGFFTAYLKDAAATAAAWECGWFHTGDVVRCAADGRLFFVDRKKNVIRRSGENISALEVEGVLQQHPLVRAAAVGALADDVRGEEVFACIVLAGPVATPGEAARQLVAWCMERLAYYKAPGHVCFIDALPLTTTNKIQRGEMCKLIERLAADPGCIDTRALKRRTA